MALPIATKTVSIPTTARSLIKFHFPYSRVHRLPRPHVRAFGPSQVLADPLGRRVLSPEACRPQGPKGREPAPGRRHEHQDSRLWVLKLLQVGRPLGESYILFATISILESSFFSDHVVWKSSLRCSRGFRRQEVQRTRD